MRKVILNIGLETRDAEGNVCPVDVDALKAAGFTTDDAFGGTFEDFATFAA